MIRPHSAVLLRSVARHDSAHAGRRFVGGALVCFVVVTAASPVLAHHADAPGRTTGVLPMVLPAIGITVLVVGAIVAVVIVLSRRRPSPR